MRILLLTCLRRIHHGHVLILSNFASAWNHAPIRQKDQKG